jgi:GxxExxY protein
MNPGLVHGSDLTHRIIGLAMRVHRRLGPGLLESVYQKCLCHELDRARISFRRQAPLPVSYDDILLYCGYVADIIVDSQVILELKSVERIPPLHESQLLTYLRLSSCRIGLLINFNTVSLADGIKRCVLRAEVQDGWTCAGFSLPLHMAHQPSGTLTRQWCFSAPSAYGTSASTSEPAKQRNSSDRA